jgi:hypothetical protein
MAEGEPLEVVIRGEPQVLAPGPALVIKPDAAVRRS